jgi:hypothetical protein
MFAKCIQGDRNGAETTLTSLWSEASVLDRISSPFVNWTILAAHAAGTTGTQNINLRSSSVLIKPMIPYRVANTFAAIATGPGLAFRLSHHPMLLRNY